MKQIGCLDGTALWIPGQQGIHDVRMRDDLYTETVTIGGLLAIAEAWSIDQLWIHHSFFARLPEPVWLSADTWDIRPEMPKRVGWYHVFRPGMPGSGVDLVIPAWPVGYDSESLWNKAPDGCALITQVAAYNAALRFDYGYTPGATGRALMRAVHGGGQSRDRRYLRLDTPVPPPPPATMHPAPARDFAWIRALTDEERGRRYLHAFDKNAMYLGACASLELGLGEWEHIEEPPYLDEIETGRPGYWHVSSAVWHNPVPGIPDLLMLDDEDDAADAWVTTPVLQAALDAHCDIYCSESYVWPEYGRFLDPWQARLRVARQELREMLLASSVFKLTYASGIGGLDGAWLRDAQEPNMLYRPDWRHMIIGRAAANLWRNVVRLVEHGISVVAVATDCIYVVSDQAVDEVAAVCGLKFGDGIGQYKIAQRNMPLGPVTEFFTGDGLGLYPLGQYLAQEAKRRRADAIHSA
jgi:hypothetical protein